MRKNTFIGYCLLFPVAIILLGVLVCGICSSIMQSLGYFPEIGKTQLTCSYYKAILQDRQFLYSLVYTFLFSFLGALLSIMIGIVLAYLVLKNKKGAAFTEKLIRIPIYVPHIVAAALIYMVFTQTGVLARVTYQLGWIQDPSEFYPLIQDPYGIGIVLAYVWKGAPFVFMGLYSILRNIDTTFVMAGQNLGANSRQTFWHIQLPLVAPTVISNFIILFAFSFGGFEIPYLVGATSPRALPVLAYLRHTSSNIEDRITAMVINVIILFLTSILLLIYVKLIQKIKKYR